MKPNTFIQAITTSLGVLLVALAASAQDARFFRIAGPVPTTITSATADGTVTWTNVATNAMFTVQIARVLQGESNWVDWVQVPVSNTVTVYRIFDPNPFRGMALIPAGSFTMGDSLDEGLADETPAHTVYVSAIYIDRFEVTKALWDEVKEFHGDGVYSYNNDGLGKATNHPVHSINWYDCVKWCNARSQRENLTPCYYVDAALTTLYQSGELEPHVKWDADGYRLPTEAEWEKAARGGVSGCRFPWGNLISHNLANYHAVTNHFSYDLGPDGFHPLGNYPTDPVGTSPVGSFPSTGHCAELHDMTGNVWEWCWDWYEAGWYSNPPATGDDPRGPAGPASMRARRGGSWVSFPDKCRTTYRFNLNPPVTEYVGFRTVRTAPQ